MVAQAGHAPVRKYTGWVLGTDLYVILRSNGSLDCLTVNVVCRLTTFKR
jgi:hypothetical protein